jgi:hypothetical protein
MGNGQQSGSGGQNDWRITITTMVGAAAGMALAMLVGNLIDIRGLWVGELEIIIGVVVGILLGRLVGGLLFPPSPGGPPNQS